MNRQNNYETPVTQKRGVSLEAGVCTVASAEVAGIKSGPAINVKEYERFDVPNIEFD